jgi:hypothetical protein
MIVLDANILIRAVLSRRVGKLLDTYAAHGIRFFAPDVDILLWGMPSPAYKLHRVVCPYCKRAMDRDVDLQAVVKVEAREGAPFSAA